MTTQRFLLVICALIATSCSRSRSLPKGVSWDKESGTFAWGSGEVKVPSGFTYQVDPGVDTFEGHFIAPDGKLILRHDIGWYAGAWASAKDASSFEERLIEGARIWTARRHWPDGRGGTTTLLAITFPDSGCANFFLYVPRVEDAQLITQLAQSYRPHLRQDPGTNNPCLNSSVPAK